MQKTTINREDLLNKVTLGINVLSEQNNEKELFQLKKLAYKIKNQESYYVFCGHFSAGKSSMLNDLLKVEKLPTSPIPTSANVVKLKKGNDRLFITLKNGEMFEVSDDIQPDELKMLCKDSSSIIELEWSQSNFNLPEGVVLIDTPGIDSTDIDHLDATNSVIHLADHIFYLMDYQHVHSKTNIDFIKSLVEKNSRVCLIITCIDKHDETELTFEEFKHGVESNLIKQGLENLTIFYLSTKVKEIENNEYLAFDKYLNGLNKNHFDTQIEHDYASLLRIVNEQIQQLESELNETEEDHTDLLEEFNRLKDDICKLDNEIDYFEENCLQLTQQVLSNSNITPFEMRDLASNYIEAEKMLQNKGLFQSRKKLELNVNEAKEKFISKVHDLTLKQIEYFIKEAAKNSLNKIELYRINSSDFEAYLEPNLGQEVLCPKPSQLVDISGNYLLQYTKELSDGIKGIYRKAINDFIQAVRKELKVQNKSLKLDLENKKVKLEVEVNEIEQNDLSNLKCKQMITNLRDVLENTSVTNQTMINFMPTLITVDDLKVRNLFTPNQVNENESIQHFEALVDEKNKLSNEEINSKYEIADKILFNLVDNRLLKNKIETLIEKRSQIKSNEYTIALFGAFSSGKSSYINTLLGKKVLPVSPHPTTAAICKIKKSTAEIGNEKADVVYKSEEAMQEEFLEFFKKWGVQVNNSNDWFKILQKLITKNKELIPSDAFIYAESVFKHYQNMKNVLGSTKRYDLSEYVNVISEESIACFVKESTVYYDCDITLNGIVLVDTPGGNSIHSRHTELAFDYLKKADLILYVAHYQHAFTRQDESFLMQIGRMRESFESDKVYFILNASDLAKDQNEIEIVINFFTNQLTKLGVRFPIVFAISSLLQMKGYTNSNVSFELEKNYKELNDKIQNYFQYEIANEVYKTFINDLVSIEKILFDSISRVERIKNEKDQYLIELNTIHTLLEEVLQNSKPTNLPRSFEKESEQLLFFIEKRIEYRMRDLFPYFFNPSIFNSSTKNSKQLFITKIREFIYEIIEEIIKEIRITGYRLEKYLSNEIVESQNRIINEISTIQNEILVQSIDNIHLETINIVQPDQFIDVNSLESLKQYYKNPKSFFVENMKENMIDECIVLIKAPLKSYLTHMEQLIDDHYKVQFINSISMVINKFSEQIENDVNQLKQSSENIEELMIDENVFTLFKQLKN